MNTEHQRPPDPSERDPHRVPPVDHHTVMDVSEQRLAKVYAEALLEAAGQQGRTQEVLEEYESLVRDVFAADARLEATFTSAAIGRGPKGELIRKVFEGRASDILLHFLLVLNDHDRLELLRGILAMARELEEKRAGRLRVLVRSAVPLEDDQRERLHQELRSTFHGEPVIDAQVDPELLGGLVVRVGDWLFDGSVRTRLRTLRDQLIERSSHEIQSGRNRFSSE